MWPQTNFRTGAIKAIVEQFSYTPAAMTCFYFIMSLLERKTIREAGQEVSKKFLPTYKVSSRDFSRWCYNFSSLICGQFLFQVALAVWPIVATINFSLIPEKNRVPFISVCSLIWTCFLAYMKHLEHRHVDEGILMFRKAES